MHCAVNVSVVIFIKILYGVNNLSRLLRGRGIVEVNEGVVVNFPF